MRQGQGSKRARGRGSGRRNLPPRHQHYDSNGPNVRIRGNASQVFEKYLQLARDATAAGDRILAENMFQHAEHYFRILNADAGEQRPQYRGNGADQDAGQGDSQGGQPAFGSAAQGAGRQYGGRGATSADHWTGDDDEDTVEDAAAHAGAASEPASDPSSAAASTSNATVAEERAPRRSNGAARTRMRRSSEGAPGEGRSEIVLPGTEQPEGRGSRPSTDGRTEARSSPSKPQGD